ncbi:uncharacterized protein ACO6RY_09116 [Pungitius sinensis]
MCFLSRAPCASSPSSAQCSILGAGAGGGGRAEQWRNPFHPQLQRSSEPPPSPCSFITCCWTGCGPRRNRDGTRRHKDEEVEH